jgi:hypothetical protein
MAKTRTTKNQIHPQRLQFGGLNLPFLNKYQDLNNQWGNFWRGNDYFGATGMLNNTINSNQSALNSFQDTQNYNKRTGASAWGDTALMYSYRNDWDRRNPNATADEKARFDNYNNFYYKYEGKAAPEWDGTSTLEAGAPGSSVSDYNAWKKGRESVADQAKKEWSANNSTYNTMNAESRKQMGQAMTNSASGIFSGLNYMNAYTPPEQINLQQGSKGVMYQDGGYVKGPGMKMSPMMADFGAIQPQNSSWAHFPSGNHAIDAIDSLLFSGRSKYYTPKTKVAEALSKYSGGDYSNHKYAKKTLGSLNANEKTELLNDIIKKEVTADNYNTNYAGVLAGRQISPSVVDYQVTSRQKGGKVKTFKSDPEYFNNKTFEPWQIKALSTGQVGIDENGVLHKLDNKVQVPQEWLDVTSNNYENSNTKEKWQADARQQQAMLGLNQFYNNPLTGIMGAGLTLPGNSTLQYLAKQAGEELISNKLNTYKDSLQRQYGGNTNLTGYTPGTPSMNNDMNEIPSGDITMEQTPIPLLAIGKGGADNGLLKVLQPQSKGYNFKSKSTVEIPLEQQQQDPTMAKYGKLIKALKSYNNGGYIQKYNGGGNVRRAVYQAANQEPFYQEPGMDTRFMTDARFNRPSLYGNPAVYQGASNQLQSVPILPTINPTVVEPMAGLGFNRDKMAAEIEVNNIKLKKGGTQKVANYQQMLKAAGYNIEVDGAWGPYTQAAYEDFIGKKAPSKTAVQTGKAKVASNIDKVNTNLNIYQRGDRNMYKFFANNTDLFSDKEKTLWENTKSYHEGLAHMLDKKRITPYEAMRLQKLAEKEGYYVPKKQYGGYVPKFQFGGSVNDQHAIPVFSSNLEDFGLTELQTEKDEVAFMPDGSIVDVKAKELHKKQDKHNVSDIMQSGTYVFSNDPKMKFGIKSKIGGVELGDMKLGKSVFKYKENEITPGPEDIMLKTMFFNNNKKELTTADIAKNVKKNLPIVDLKNDYFADRAIAENKDQRLEYLSILKAFNEFKKPKSRSIPKAQYGMPIQPTQNGLDGVMGYGDKQMDPFKRMDNNMVSMWNIPQPKLPSIPKMYEDGGIVPQAQFGWLADGVDAIGGWSRRAEKEQRRKNGILSAEAQGYRDELQDGVDRSGTIGVGTNLATYAASLNVPLQRYDDQSEAMAIYNAAANRTVQRLEASKYTASQGIGGASSLARYSNPTNYGDYLSKVQSQSDSNIGRINQAIADLDMARANQNVGFVSARNAGRNQSLNARDTQLYNANIQGIGNVGRSAQEATFNTADTKYRLGNEKIAYDAYLEDKAKAAKQEKQQQIRGYTNEIGQLGLTYATGGFGGGKLFDKDAPTTTAQNINPYGFNGTQGYDMSNYTSNPYGFNGVTGDPRFGGNAQHYPTINTINPGGLVNRSGANTGNFMNRNTDNWDYNFFDVNTWRY